MLNHLSSLRLAPGPDGEPAFGGGDAGGSVGTSASTVTPGMPVGPGSAAFENADGEPAFGNMAAVEDHDGESAFGPGSMPGGGEKSDPATAAPAKPAASADSAAGNTTAANGEVLSSDDTRTVISAVFGKEMYDETLRTVGPKGLDMLFRRAEQYLVSNGHEGAEQDDQNPDGSGGAGHAGAAPAGSAAPGSAPATPPAPSAPAGANPAAAVPFAVDPEAVEQFKSVVGEDGYDKVVAPILRHAQKQSQQIAALDKTINDLTFQINYRANNSMLDSLNDRRLGNSRDTLNPGQVEARKEVINFALGHLQRNRTMSAVKALESGLASFIAAQNIAARQQGGAPAPANAPAPSLARQRQIGVVPDRTVGSFSAPSGRGKAAVFSILDRLPNG